MTSELMATIGRFWPPFMTAFFAVSIAKRGNGFILPGRSGAILASASGVASSASAGGFPLRWSDPRLRYLQLDEPGSPGKL